VVRLNGWRGAGLLFVALASCLTRGYRYALQSPGPLPAGIADLSFDGLLIRFLGALWLLAGVVGIWSAFRLHDRPGVFALAFMHALWSAALVLGWLFGPGDWLSAVTTFGTFGLIVCWSRMVNAPRGDVEELLSHTGGE